MSAGENSRRARAEALVMDLYAEHRSYLLNIAKANVSVPEDAEEALQEAILIFIAKGDPDTIAEPLAWLTLVLKRECWQMNRRQRIAETLREQDEELGLPGAAIADLPSEGRGPAEYAELSERAREVRAAMEQLKPQEREVLSLIALGYSYKEIQDLTGYTHTKVNRCSAEGRARLRALGLDIYKCR